MAESSTEPVITASPAAAHSAWLSSLNPSKNYADEWRTHDAFSLEARQMGWRHYDVGDEMIWRFCTKPSTELISISAGVDIDTIIKVIGKHSGGDDKSNVDVRTSSFCRNVGALIGAAASTGGDKNVLFIANNAEYLCGIDIGTLAAHGISAHPALFRLISMFETEYVLVATPGNAPISLDTLATVKIPNPFKGRIDKSGRIKNSAVVLPITGVLNRFTAPRDPVVADEIVPVGGVAPAWADNVLRFAVRVSKAATPLSGVLQDKEGLVDDKLKSSAMKRYLENL